MSQSYKEGYKFEKTISLPSKQDPWIFTPKFKNTNNNQTDNVTQPVTDSLGCKLPLRDGLLLV